jgi:hypothetical protein
VRRIQARAPAFWLTLALQTACASRSVPPATGPCRISIGQDGKLNLVGLPALSADGARVAVSEPCDGPKGSPCLAILLFSVDGKVQDRLEVAGPSVSEGQIRRANQLLSDGLFAPMTSLKLPFSAYDLNIVHLRVSDIAIHYGASTLIVDRDDHRLATVDLPTTVDCTGPRIVSLFFDDKTHTLAAEFEYQGVGCLDSPPGWRVLRFP